MPRKDHTVDWEAACNRFFNYGREWNEDPSTLDKSKLISTPDQIRINGLPLLIYRRFAHLTSKIDYGCRFDEHGFCQKSLNYAPKEELERLKGTDDVRCVCCCDRCAREAGYFFRDHNGKPKFDQKQWKLLCSLFDEKLGFWRSTTGCLIPRRYRSQICLTHCCDHSKLQKVDEMMLQFLADDHVCYKTGLRRNESLEYFESQFGLKHTGTQLMRIKRLYNYFRLCKEGVKW